MNTERLFHELESMHPVSDAFKERLLKEITQLSLPKNFILLQAPKISDQVYFLDQGSAMCYSFIDGNRRIEWLWQHGQIVVSPKSFFQQLPSREFIVLLEQSEVLCLSYKHVSELFEKFPEANFIYRIIMNKYFERSRDRLRAMQGMTGEQRYNRLLQSFNKIEQLLPQQDIASYLGITPQSLSRIKGKMARR